MEKIEKVYDLIIIGGGASGLTLGIIAKNCGKSVMILEANDRVGKKILATGNGKCNLSNAHINICNYNTKAVDIFIKQQSKVCQFFDMIGLKTKLVEDRYYPYSESSNTVLNLLRNKLSSEHILTGYKVDTIISKNGAFIINDKFIAKKVAICTGSNANFGINSHNLLTYFGHTATNLYPSLVPLITDTTFIKNLSGLRAKVDIKLINENNQVLTKQYGEILFKNNGISGIAVFMLSSYIARNKGKYKVSIDFTPDLEEKVIKNFIENNNIYGLLHKQIADCVVMQAKSRKIEIYKAIKDFQIENIILGNIKNAQVCCGGVPLNEFNENLESKKCANLYACGEVLDVDGDCGGYNLNWAFLSAIIVGESL